MSLVCRYATPAEIESWDELVANNPDGGSYLTGEANLTARKTLGLNPRQLVFEDAGNIVSVAVAFERKIPFFGNHWYICRGPAVVSQADFDAHLTALQTFIKNAKTGVFSVLVEPPFITVDERVSADKIAENLMFEGKPNNRDLIASNNDTVIVNIDKSDDDLLASFNKSCRYEVRKALKDGCEVKRYAAEQSTFDEMIRLNKLVGGGKVDIVMRPNRFLESFWQYADSSSSSNSKAQFFAIENEGVPAVMAWIYCLGENAYYVYGGSERPRTTPGMSNLLQYEAMKWARDMGAKTYNMLGIAPAWAKSVEDHSSYSLNRFKLSFGGRVTYTGAYDVPINAFKTKLWLKIGERVFAKLYRERTGDPSIY